MGKKTSVTATAAQTAMQNMELGRSEGGLILPTQQGGIDPLLLRWLSKGKCYFAHTLTFAWVGRLADFSNDWLVLQDSSWVAYTGTYSKAFEMGKFEEVEALPETTSLFDQEANVTAHGAILVYCRNLVSIVPWENPLPKFKKS